MRDSAGVSPALVRASEIAARALVLGIGVLAVALVLARLRLVVFPTVIALLLATVLAPVVVRLTRFRLPRAAAAAAAFFGFLAVLAGVIGLVVPAIVDGMRDLGPTLSQAVDDFQSWLVDGPAGLDRSDVQRLRRNLTDEAGGFVTGSSARLFAGAIVVAEVVAGALLALVLTFFFLKDGPQMQQWALDHVGERHRGVVEESSRRAWSALGGYLRGAALLGVVEAVILGGALLIVGAGAVAVPVATITFLAAFFPVVGAVLAGTIAVAVALVSGGVGDAVVLGVVAIVVQQFDNDLLAPVVYGRATRLHPVVVLLSITAGATIGGIAGAFLAVPTAAVAVAVGGVLWEQRQRSGGGAAVESG